MDYKFLKKLKKDYKFKGKGKLLFLFSNVETYGSIHLFLNYSSLFSKVSNCQFLVFLEFTNGKTDTIEFEDFQQMNSKHSIFNQLFELLLKRGIPQETNSYEKIVKTKEQLNKWRFLPVFTYLLFIKNVEKVKDTKAVFVQSYDSEPWEMEGKIAFFGNYVGNVLIDELFVCEGELTGTVSGNEKSILEIKGNVKGNINKIPILITRNGSKIEGDISCGILVTESGTLVNGRIEVGNKNLS